MAQPALLYLSPSTVGTTLVLAWRRGELRGLWFGLNPDQLKAYQASQKAAAAAAGSPAAPSGDERSPAEAEAADIGETEVDSDPDDIDESRPLIN